MMDRRTFIGVVACATLAAPLAAEAQGTVKVWRIGYLRRTTPIPADLEAFRQGLREQGYVEGQNIVIEQRYANGAPDRLPALAAELIRLPVDVLVVDGTPTVIAARAATRTIPIVFTVVTNPVRMGFVASLARPGGNITGLSNNSDELAPKRLQLLKEAVPAASRLAVLRNPENLGVSSSALQAAVSPLSVQIVEARNSSEWAGAFAAMDKGRADAVTVLPDATFASQPARLVALTLEHRLPAIFAEREFAEAGGLMSYGPSTQGSFRQAAAYVDKILKGAKPGDLPVELPTKFELVINLKTAKALGLTMPQVLLLRADELIP
jgi:putative ABC transport system substrate-binding protein